MIQSIAWDCDLISQTEPFYRQIPHFLHSALPRDEATQTAHNLNGNCFENISVAVNFSEDQV